MTVNLRLYRSVFQFVVGLAVFYGLIALAVLAIAEKSRDIDLGPNTSRTASPGALSIRTLDPVGLGDSASNDVAIQLYDGLVQFQPTTLEIRPCLAEKWTISPDGRTYTFFLRQGVHFYDGRRDVFKDQLGREVTAYDVKYNLQRVCDPKALSTGYWLFKKRVVGAEEYFESRSTGDGKVTEVTGFEAVDPYTFRIHLTEPFWPFLKRLAMPYGFIAAPEALEKYGKDYSLHPVGTGPFWLYRWEDDVEVILRKNPDYWEKDERGNPLPYLDAIHRVARRNAHTAFLEFEGGNTDATGIPDYDWERVLTPERRLKPRFQKYELRHNVLYSVEYYGFGVRNPPFANNRKLRQAFNFAIDRQAIIDKINHGVGFPAYGPIPPGLSGHDPDNKAYQYDPEKARRLLAEAGYPDGKGLPELALNLNEGGGPNVDMAQAILDDLAAIGVRVRLLQQSWPLHLSDIETGKAKFFRLGWMADYPDAENFLALFYSKNFSPEGPNSTFYSSPEFDRLYEQALRESDSGRRATIYRAAEKVVVQDAPWLFIMFGEAYGLRQSYVVSPPPNPMAYVYDKYIRLEKGPGREG